MKVIIDIAHHAHVNFYKNTIDIFNKKYGEVSLIVRPRGSLVEIIKKECPNNDIISIGTHHHSLLGKMLGLVKRDIQLMIYLHKKEFDLSTGVAGFYIAPISRILGKPSVLFYDDFEYKSNFYLSQLTATRYVIPSCIPITKRNILKYNGFKELAYLHPNYFKPNKKALEQYELAPYNYVFIREVSGISLNYKNFQYVDLSTVIHHLKKLGFKIILSLEDKNKVDRFNNDCIILEEPIDDIHSLLSFASFTISSGDSMARESCLVGTPSIYTGGRDMIINKELIKRSCMFKVDDKQHLKDVVKNIIENDIKKETEETIKHAIKYEWEDTTEVIINNLLSVIYKDDSLIEKYQING